MDPSWPGDQQETNGLVSRLWLWLLESSFLERSRGFFLYVFLAIVLAAIVGIAVVALANPRSAATTSQVQGIVTTPTFGAVRFTCETPVDDLAPGESAVLSFKDGPLADYQLESVEVIEPGDSSGASLLRAETRGDVSVFISAADTAADQDTTYTLRLLFSNGDAEAVSDCNVQVLGANDTKPASAAGTVTATPRPRLVPVRVGAPADTAVPPTPVPTSTPSLGSFPPTLGPAPTTAGGGNPTNTPRPTRTPRPTSTPRPPTPTPVPPTATPEPPTATPVPPTATPEPPTPTPEPPEPTAVPTEEPTAVPTEEPTAVPTEEPTAVPTEVPTEGAP